jgi:hypothetical protein
MLHVAGDRGNWMEATPGQKMAYEAFMKQDETPLLKVNVRNGGYYMIRSRSAGQSNRRTEIQDRQGIKYWRVITELVAPKPTPPLRIRAR